MGASHIEGRRPRGEHGRRTTLARTSVACANHEQATRRGTDHPDRLVEGPDVRAHLTVLRELGWTWTQIAALAGCSRFTPADLHSGRTSRILASTAAALLAIPAVLIPSPRGIPATGTRRRVQGLARLGWPRQIVAARAGIPAHSLTVALSRDRIGAARAVAIKTVYDQLCGTPGPSQPTAARAATLGWPSALAWPDDESLDDPAARPTGTRTPRRPTSPTTTTPHRRAS